VKCCVWSLWFEESGAPTQIKSTVLQANSPYDDARLNLALDSACVHDLTIHHSCVCVRESEEQQQQTRSLALPSAPSVCLNAFSVHWYNKTTCMQANLIRVNDSVAHCMQTWTSRLCWICWSVRCVWSAWTRALKSCRVSTPSAAAAWRTSWAPDTSCAARSVASSWTPRSTIYRPIFCWSAYWTGLNSARGTGEGGRGSRDARPEYRRLPRAQLCGTCPCPRATPRSRFVRFLSIRAVLLMMSEWSTCCCRSSVCLQRKKLQFLDWVTTLCRIIFKMTPRLWSTVWKYMGNRCSARAAARGLCGSDWFITWVMTHCGNTGSVFVTHVLLLLFYMLVLF